MNRYGDRAADDATDDDTLHQFLLHTQRKEREITSSRILRKESSLSSFVDQTNKGAASMLVEDLFVNGEYASRMRSSNLKRCLRYLKEQELTNAAFVCVHWRDAAADSRLW